MKPLEFCDLKHFDGFQKEEFLEPYYYNKEARKEYWMKIEEARKNGTGQVYAVTNYGEFVGVCHRYNFEGEWAIGYAILPKWRGIGLGKVAIRFISQVGDYAFVKPNNDISKKMLKSNGFIKKLTINNYEVWQKIS